MKTMYDHDRLIARFPRPKLTLGCSSKNLTRSVALAGTSLPSFVTIKSVCSCFPMFVIFRPKIQRLGNPFGCTKVREVVLRVDEKHIVALEFFASTTFHTRRLLILSEYRALSRADLNLSQLIRSSGFVGSVSRLFCVDFKPGLRNVGAEVHEKSAVKLRDF